MCIRDRWWRHRKALSRAKYLAVRSVAISSDKVGVNMAANKTNKTGKNVHLDFGSENKRQERLYVIVIYE